MAAARSSFVPLMLLLACCCLAASAADEKLTHLHFYAHEVIVGTPNATVVTVVSLNKSGAPAFGDLRVVDNALREGPDPASRLIGRMQGFVVIASLDGTSYFSALDFVFSGDYGQYSGSTLSVQGNFDLTGGPSERSIIGGTGKLQFARGYLKGRLLSSTNTTYVIVFDMYFTLAH